MLSRIFPFGVTASHLATKLADMAILFIDHGVVGGMGSLGLAMREYAQRIVTLRGNELASAVKVSLEDIHGVVVGDAPSSVRLTDDSHQSSMMIVAEAHNLKIPIIGLGFGALVIAKSLGSAIDELNPPEAGWTNMTTSPMSRGDALLTGVPWTLAVPFWSCQSIGSAGPSMKSPGMRSLASTPRQKFAMFACGVSTYGITAHIEWTAGAADAALQSAGSEQSTHWREGAALNSATCQRIAKKIFESVTLSLMPVGLVNVGVGTICASDSRTN